jgi:cell division protein FtsI (penicillin-binding protein 3)
MNAPRYAVYFMLDEPKGNKETGGYATAGAVSAPGAGRVIARIAPMLGLFPDIQHEQEVQASLAIPMEPARGSGERTGTGSPLDPPPPPPAPTVPAATSSKTTPVPPANSTTPPVATVALPPPRAKRELLALRHEAAYHVPLRPHADH